jgi:hypothetical protein
MRSRTWGYGIAVASIAVAALMPLTASAVDSTVVVTPGDIGSSWFTADTRAPGTGTFTTGPATPPLGTGSFELRTTTNSEKVQLFTNAYNHVKLANIDGIGYSTYRDPSSLGFVAGVAALNIRIDLTNDGIPDAYMVYEPYQDQGNAAVQSGTWQAWDAYRGGAAKWWINTGAGGCFQNTPCTWSSIVAAFPTASVQEGNSCGPGGITSPCPGSLGVNQGSYNPKIISNVDALYVSVSGAKTTYNFELIRDLDGDGIADTPPPTSKNSCKHDGWESFNNPTFKNQGDCVSYVATNGKNPGNG